MVWLMNAAFLKQQLIEQSRLALHISNRDLGKRMISVALMVWICRRAGLLEPAVLAATFATVNEVTARVLYRFLPRDPARTTVQFALLVWLNSVVSIVPYLAFPVLLAGQPSVALLMVGYMWLFAIYVHTANTFVLLPLFNWSMMIPAYLGGFWVFAVAAGTTFTSSPIFDWVLATSMMSIYIVNTHDTMNKQKDTNAALAQAQHEAADRLLQLEHLSNHDKLTGLANRNAYDLFLERALLEADDTTYMFLIDLDDFKPINDSYSHQAGDVVLQELAERLRKFNREDGVLARLGGDEFALLRRGLDNDAKAHSLATRIVSDIVRPIPFEGKQLRVGASIGLAKAATQGDTVEAICSRADQAMYRAKGDPNRRVFQYDPAILPRRATLDDRAVLLDAIKSGEIHPYYQPKVCIRTGKVLGFEALARWHHPTDGLLSPAGFLPQIREFGLTGDLLINIAARALVDIEKMKKSGNDPGQVSINVPEETLATVTGRNDLLEVIDRVPQLRHHLTFEITEDVFIARSGGLIASTISFFRNEGVRISLDDFGTGFASFQHLRDLEFDELKIDTGFVHGLGKDAAAEVLVEGFLTIGRGLGVQVVAEGVETEWQRDMLLDMGCEIAQGYLYAKALSIDDASAFLSRSRQDSSVA